MSPRLASTKRALDICIAAAGLALLWPIILIAILLARHDTNATGLFHQKRVGKGGAFFTVHKIRTMREMDGTTITTAHDKRITPLGQKLRQWKIDELPQLWNVLKGEMSMVGPRPDVPGYANQLEGEDRVILRLRPGITGPGSLKYRDEEVILAKQADPQHYNDTVIWPDKVAINRDYYENYRLCDDFRYLWQTIFRK